MKQFTLLNETMLLIIFSSSIFLFVACGNNQNSQDAKSAAEERNEAKFNENRQQEDAQFLVNASEINLKQIQLGQLAQQKGRTTDVTELGKRIEDTHTKSQRDLRALAQSKRISIPTSLTNNAREDYNNLNGKSGYEFDEAYANMMVNEKKDAISTFERASTDSHDREIKNWASANLREMRTNLDHSIDCQKKFADMHFDNNR